MTKEEIFNSVQNIFRDIFKKDDLTISDSTSPDDIEEWDSLNHINLIITITKEFNINFSLEEMASLNNAGSLIDAIMKKI